MPECLLHLGRNDAKIYIGDQEAGRLEASK